MDGGVDRTARLAFFTTRFRAFRRTHFLCVENYIRKVLFHVFSQILGVEPGRDVTIRDGLLLNAGLIVMGAFRHWICLGELEFVFRILKHPNMVIYVHIIYCFGNRQWPGPN